MCASPRSASEESDFITWVNRQMWLYGCDLRTELAQAREEGRDLSAVEADFRRLMAVEPKVDYFEHVVTGKRNLAWFDEARALIDRVQTLPLRRDYPFFEPSDLRGIRAERPSAVKIPAWKGSPKERARRIRGGFLARVAGCMLGKPFECVDRRTIRLYGEATGNWPLREYLREPSHAELAGIMKQSPRRPVLPWQANFYINRNHGFPSDDDINYTVVGMEAMRRYGAKFAPLDIATIWTQQIPVIGTCTAERVAYRNFVEGRLPPHSATHRNPYREWIGAQIRADFFGYAAAGNPAQAAEWGWRDASISHVRNGIYGEMWVAAMLAAAFVLNDWRDIIVAGLAQVPRNSRFRLGVDEVLALHADGVPFETLVDGLHREWDEFDPHGWCHTISNAQIVAAALLYGEDDFAKTISRAVSAGFDTDCNGATCGSLWGVRHGEDAIPSSWLRPLKNRLKTGLQEYADGSLDAMAERMVEIAARVGG